MKHPVRHFLLRIVSLAGVLASTVIGAAGQFGAAHGEWRTYGGDLGSTRYSPLEQVNAGNFDKLEVAWRFKTDHLGPQPEFEFQSTPLMVNGVVYSTGGTRRAVVALDAATGELLWMHSENEGKRGSSAPRKLSGRGLSYWSDGKDERILYVTPGYQLIALDAKTGYPVRSFGNSGAVDLKQDDDQVIDLVTGDVGLHAAPVVAMDTIIIGAAHLTGRVPKSRANVKGFVRGYDVRTGRRLWIFHTIPLPGEVGNDTWEKDSWSYTGNTGVWAQMTVDDELGIVYLPVETPTGDEYGGHRPGNGLFGETLVALDLKTGKRLWHYQIIHHGIWDWDLPCAPILADITVNGTKIKAIAQPTKQAWVHVFDRVTGKPVWPIEERPVPQSDAPGEKTSPSQPFPTSSIARERHWTTSSISHRRSKRKPSRSRRVTSSVRFSRRPSSADWTVLSARSCCPRRPVAPTGKADRTIRRPAFCTSFRIRRSARSDSSTLPIDRTWTTSKGRRAHRLRSGPLALQRTVPREHQQAEAKRVARVCRSWACRW
jgi:quinoprotein glucose dehydrogenase